jgi:hypothetical protein
MGKRLDSGTAGDTFSTFRAGKEVGPGEGWMESGAWVRTVVERKQK